VEYLEADWMSSDSTSLGERRFDWVLASDVLYERHYPEAVARAFHRHANPGATLILTDPGRPALQAFHDAAKVLGMEFQTRIVSVPEGKTARDIFVLESQFSRARD
jgi:SAM-dependent methyltransferase